MAERPGVMLYFDLCQAIDMLDDASAGQLFKGILSYAKFGVVPEFEGMVSMAWSFIRPKIDRDNEQYEKIVIDKQYASYCSHTDEAKRLSREEWYETIYLQQPAHAATCQQTQPTSTPTASSSRTSVETTATTRPGEGEATGSGGREGGTPFAAPLPDSEEAALNEKRIEAIRQLEKSIREGARK